MFWLSELKVMVSGGSSIILKGQAPTPKVDVLTYFWAENCMKMKESGPSGGCPWRPPYPLRSATDDNLMTIE